MDNKKLFDSWADTIKTWNLKRTTDEDFREELVKKMEQGGWTRVRKWHHFITQPNRSTFILDSQTIVFHRNDHRPIRYNNWETGGADWHREVFFLQGDAVFTWQRWVTLVGCEEDGALHLWLQASGHNWLRRPTDEPHVCTALMDL